MSSFSNIFQSNFKDYPETPEEFTEYKLEFLSPHEQSFKQLGDVLFTKDDEKSSLGSPKKQTEDINQEEEDLFDLEVEIKLRRYTSFQNGFMENHRKVLKNSLEQFLAKSLKFCLPIEEKVLLQEINGDIKSILFHELLFTHEQIIQNRERLLNKVDEYKILKEIYQSSGKMSKSVAKDAIMMGMWILRHTDHLVHSIIHENSFCIKQVEKVKQELLNYLESNENIDVIKQMIAQETLSQNEFTVMIESWLYTLLIAKLGYFQNDCFDESVSLQEHLKALLKEEKRHHSVVSDSEDDDIMNIQCSMKKRKL